MRRGWKSLPAQLAQNKRLGLFLASESLNTRASPRNSCDSDDRSRPTFRWRYIIRQKLLELSRARALRSRGHDGLNGKETWKKRQTKRKMRKRILKLGITRHLLVVVDVP